MRDRKLMVEIKEHSYMFMRKKRDLPTLGRISRFLAYASNRHKQQLKKACYLSL